MNTQAVCKILGDTGCYFLSLLHAVKADYEALRIYQLSLEKGYIDDDCYINDPAAVLKLITGNKWSVSHETAKYMPKDDELEILRFERKTTGTTYSHFVVGDGHGNVAYDPLGKSQTVQHGKLVSKRILRRV